MRLPSTPDCSIKGCTRAARRSGLCAKHDALVPCDLRMSGYLAGLKGQMAAVSKAREQRRRYVQWLIRQGKAS